MKKETINKIQLNVFTEVDYMGFNGVECKAEEGKPALLGECDLGLVIVDFKGTTIIDNEDTEWLRESTYEHALHLVTTLMTYDTTLEDLEVLGFKVL